MTFIDFFSGIGGFRLGMEMAGHECVGHCEIDEHANRSYIAMHKPKESEWYARDITTIRASDLPEADVYCFGFPCQSFSIAGKRRGFQDTRGTLFFEVMRLAKERKPKYLFAENVAGLLNHDGGGTFETIIRTMEELGYGVEWQVCNSKHFGVPQNRERVFIVGHLGGISRRTIFPITTDGGETTKLQRYKDVRTLITKKSDGKEPYQQDRVYNPDGVSPALMRDKADLNIVANTICARSGTAESVGTYIATDRQTDRQTDNDIKSKRISQGLVAGTMEYKKPILTDTAHCLDTKCGDIRGFMNNYIIEHED